MKSSSSTCGGPLTCSMCLESGFPPGNGRRPPRQNAGSCPLREPARHAMSLRGEAPSRRGLQGIFSLPGAPSGTTSLRGPMPVTIFTVFEWTPLCSCPVRLRRKLNSSVRRARRARLRLMFSTTLCSLNSREMSLPVATWKLLLRPGWRKSCTTAARMAESSSSKSERKGDSVSILSLLRIAHVLDTTSAAWVELWYGTLLCLRLARATQRLVLCCMQRDHAAARGTW
mmetsp:Transcript_34407/g.81531  ORF Transcript_34407/g.81531 Transcript_34407/m.81531 type:complete len:228 (+) Transcript_34407:1175-1858(+)